MTTKTADGAFGLAEPECRTCEDWGTVVITNEHGREEEVPCPDHVESVPVGTPDAVVGSS